MKKIAIITELSLNSVNYGNYMQAYALNKYLRNIYPDSIIETIEVDRKAGRKITSYFSYLSRIIDKTKKILKNGNAKDIAGRKKCFRKFASICIKMSTKQYTFSDIQSSDYDYYIVGSDIVWIQSKGFINKVKFLAFEPVLRHAKKIAYAASFGENYIPKENMELINKYLMDFNSISVREISSIELLSKIGIHNVANVCDPTLLLEFIRNSEEYVFAYVLGNQVNQIEKIRQKCAINKIELLYIPCTDGKYIDNEKDNPLLNCSPQEWIWLIQNAKYVITDSFHGLMFSVIFNRNFFVIKRVSNRNINIRLYDFLNKIGATEKNMLLDEIDIFCQYSWNYSLYNERICKYIIQSKNFLINAIES